MPPPNIMIPRLTPKQVKSVKNSRAVPLIHYTGPKKVLPPAVSKNIEIRSVCSTDQSGSCPKERCRVAQFPHEGARCNGVEWFQQLLSQESECSETCKHIHVWSIDAPPSHPDIILTTLTYMQKSLLDMGMIHIHLSMDMQPFEVTNKYVDTIL